MIFFIDIIISIISSTQIACDVMCVQYVQKQPPEVFFKKNVFRKSFDNFTGKHLRWNLFLIKLQALRPTEMFSLEISKVLRTPILKNIYLRTTADQMICN